MMNKLIRKKSLSDVRCWIRLPSYFSQVCEMFRSTEESYDVRWGEDGENQCKAEGSVKEISEAKISSRGAAV
jgi:hypothetical protein